MNKKNTEKKSPIDAYDYLGKSASATDCTGLIPSAPTSSDELDSYEDVYDYLPSYCGKPKSDSDLSSK